MKLRVLSYNIRYGGGGREDAISRVISACTPDIVILEEAIQPPVVERLATICGFKHYASVRGESLAFLSRLNISRHEWHDVRFGRRKYLEIVLAGSGTRIYGIHLSAIHSNLTELRRTWELRALLQDVKSRATGFHFLTGDFNTLAPGERLDLRQLPVRLRVLAWITGGNIRWRTIQMMLDAGYTDGYRMYHKDEGFTFPTWDPHVRLDYIFLPSASAKALQRCEVIRNVAQAKEASDHFPLLSELEI